jgi:coniferyl-aldehyde dehydrogenase|tara:strand:+ start:72 stop:1460 length:1389 start_codon:yes stop_codon:yes gene_type:complete
MLTLENILEIQKKDFSKSPYPSLKQRKEHLKLILKILSDYKQEWIDAISTDFGHRSKYETLMMELMQTQHLIKFVLSKLRRWMRPSTRNSGLLNIPAKSKIYHQPLGVVGIISPWNYPLDLALSPLVYALASGNRVMIKPSEHTPKTSELLQKLISKYFDIEYVAICCGDVETGIAFSKLPFNHLMFTGSTKTGKLIMASAAQNLTPVTLELGGKSPTIIGPDADISAAARRICFGKSINSGQTCIAPDHIYIPSGMVDSFVTEYRKSFEKMYPNGEEDQGYSCIINQFHFDRLQELIDDAKSKGARIEAVAEWKRGNKFPPHFVFDSTKEMKISQTEIFGPLLPIITYTDISETIKAINSGEKPLALYYFGFDRKLKKQIIEETHSGGIVFNDTVIQFAIKSLPFGGVGASGMGKYHGREGFETFSQAKPVVFKGRINPLRLAYPPYGNRVHKLLERFFIK